MSSEYFDEYPGGMEAYLGFNEHMKQYEVKDKNVRSVIDKMASRAKVGYDKYGVTTERTDIDLEGWLVHLQEELLDAAIYIQRVKEELDNGNSIV